MHFNLFNVGSLPGVACKWLPSTFGINSVFRGSEVASLV